MTSTEIEVRQSSAVAVQEELTIDQLHDQVQLIQQAMQKVMKKGEHYGTIPGAGSKMVLFKAGAEKLCLLFRLDPEYTIEETFHEDGHYTVRATCVLYHVTTGNRQGSGVGLCTSKEKKYAFVRGNPNPNLPDTYNTILKMACKRAQTAAVLTTTGASDIFTQDLEDAVETVTVPVPDPASKETYEELISIIGTASRIDETLWGVEVLRVNASRRFGRPIGALKELSEVEARQIIEGAQAWVAAQLAKAEQKAEAEPEVSTIMDELKKAQAEQPLKRKPKADFPPNVTEEPETVDGEAVEVPNDVKWPGEAPA
jgi:hypothetical protein